MSKLYQKEYCLECARTRLPGCDLCECGSRSFVYGNKYNLQDGIIVCECGKSKLVKVDKLNHNDSIYTVHQCVHCQNVVGIEIVLDKKGKKRRLL